MSRIFFALCSLLLIAAFTPATANADPLLITTGTLSVTGAIGGPRFTFSGDDFSVSGGGERGNSAPQVGCSPCVSGQIISVNGTFIGSSLDSGSAIFNGVDRGSGLGGIFQLSGPAIQVPFSLSNLTITSPFTFSGHLIVCPQTCFLGPQVFSADFIGAGTATIDLTFSGLFNGKPVFTFQKVTYQFEVPEPVSIMLLGGGLAALAAKLRLSRRRRF